MSITPSRRAVLASVVAAAASPADATTETARPNILWLVSEDNCPLLGAYGDRLAHTPRIDRLAAQGVRYTNVYSTAPVCAPSRFGIITGRLPESFGPAHNMRAEARLPAFVRGFPELLRAAGYHCTNNAKTDYNCDLDPARIWDRSGPDAHWRHRPPGRPFFAVFNFGATHESTVFAPTAGRARPQDARLPAYLPDTPGMREEAASYYNRMEIMDGQIATRLEELAADGLAEDTVVFYYSDNGGVLPRSKRYCYQEGLRCALVVHVPPRWAHLAPGPPGSVVEAPVTLPDLGPSVLSLAGVPPPAGLDGRAILGAHAAAPRRLAFGMRNRMDERYDMVRTVTDGRFRYIRNYTPHRPWGQHQAYAWQARGYQDWEQAWLDGRLNAAQARFWGRKPFEEFYDLNADPDQVENLMGRGHTDVAQSLSAALDAHMLAVNDNGFIPEGSPLEGYEASRTRGAYPLAQVIRLAGQAARGEARRRRAFEADLADPNEVVRYWAAQGLLILGPKAAASMDALGPALDHDSSPHVRIVAAEAIAGLGDAVRGVTALTAMLSHSHPRVRLQALNALTFIGPAARDALPAIETARNSGDPYLGMAGAYLVRVLQGRYTPASPIFREATPGVARPG